MNWIDEMFTDYDIFKDEIYHKNYSYEYIDKCDELGLENIEEYTCQHFFGADCGTTSGCEMIKYFCIYCSKPSNRP